MDKSVNQSRLSRAQLPPQEAGNPALSLDQLTDLDQAISLSRGSSTEAPSRPTPVSTRAVPRPVLSRPAPAPKPVQKPAPKPISQPISSQPAPEAPEPAPETPPVPVRSAKEAINAMYASDNPARLSDYLGASAKEIINATARAGSDYDAKSAASLHHANSQRRMETARPSASALFRAAKSETTVVRTSLELDPKSPKTAKKPANTINVADFNSPKSSKTSKTSPIVINSRSFAANPRRAAGKIVTSVRPKKGQINITTPSATSVAVSAIEQAAGAITGATAKNSAKTATKSANLSSRPKSPRSRGGLVQDIARPARPSDLARTAVNSVAHPIKNSKIPQIPQKPSKSPKLATNSAANSQADPYQKLPADSVKRRFRLAPKGFAANKPEQARPARRKFMSFSNPDYSVPIPKPTPAVEIYGLTEPEPEERSKDGLGIVEDYRPQNPANPAMGTSAANNTNNANDISRATSDSDTYEVPTPGQRYAAQTAASKSGSKSGGKSAKDQKSAPDNNRYTLGGQSPFFLKTVNVEKRPLSDGPTRRADTISPIYTDPGDELPRKNIYDGKSGSKSAKSGGKSTKKVNPRDLPQRPTVIIPSSRRSHTPLFLLLILTVILGAAVGAAVYFFFFQ